MSTWLLKLAMVAFVITLVPQGVWSALILSNLRVAPSVPWAVLVMTALLVVGASYLGGRWGPARTAEARRRSLRATLVSREVLAWSLLAGALSMIALTAAWILIASFVRMPGSVLPDLSGAPRWAGLLAVAVGALISPLCEQAGLWGYWQEGLERRWPAPAAILVTAMVFALGPHPPLGAPFLPKLLFFFLTGLTFSLMAYFTDSILPSIPVHALGLLVFFTVVWPRDPGRRAVAIEGADAWFWIHIAQLLLCAALAALAFGRLSRLGARAASRR